MFDVVIIGAGAAGLAAAIFAGERAAALRAAAGTVQPARILLLEGAKKPGAKILVSGGGRCNVTHEKITPQDYWGGPHTIVGRVLRAFDVSRTLQWMDSLDVELKLEPTGKYFPVTDEARTVLEALLRRVKEVGVELRTGARVERIEREGGDPARPEAFRIVLREAGGGAGDGAEPGGGAGDAAEPIRARRVILASGGQSLPKSGSDGWGFAMLRELGHELVATTPALAPLVCSAAAGDAGAVRRAWRDVLGPTPAEVTAFSGVTLESARLSLVDAGGRRLHEEVRPLVFTHFGISGPGPMNLSRHFLRARMDSEKSGAAAAPVVVLGHPGFPTLEEADAWLRSETTAGPRRMVTSAIESLMPSRIAHLVAGGNGFVFLSKLTREQRLDVARRLAGLPLPISGDRGWAFAETTAGGLDLREVDPVTFESRRVRGLHVCGEVLDVDGRIGGFNFQWAWATGWLAGRGAIERALSPKE